MDLSGKPFTIRDRLRAGGIPSLVLRRYLVEGVATTSSR